VELLSVKRAARTVQATIATCQAGGSATEFPLCARPQVDVYSFSMILYQLFEHQPPFAGTDPVEAARQAALYEYRPPLSQLKGRLEPFPVRQRCPQRQTGCASMPGARYSRRTVPSGCLAV
jgi:hypothetical protein